MYLFVCFRSCPQNPWANASLLNTNINPPSLDVQKSTVNQTSVECSQGLEVPYRAPPPYTEKNKNATNCNFRRRPSFTEEEKNAHSYKENVGRMTIFQPLSSSPPFSETGNYSWNLPSPVHATTSLNKVAAKRFFYKSTQV